MSRPEAERDASLPQVPWRLTLGEPAGYDGAGVYAFAEVDGPGFTADALVLLIDEPGLETADVLASLRRSVSFHEWVDLQGILPIRAIERHTDRVAVVSEAFPAQPLSRVVGAVPIPPRASGELASLLAETLHDLHTMTLPGSIKPAGLAHGGIDLDHVLISRSGEVRLSGTGLAGALRRRGVEAVDMGFLAPEVRGGGQPAAPADVYAATLILLTCLIGRPPEPFPVHPEAHERAVDAVIAGAVGLDEEVADLIRAGLAVSPDARPSASAFAGRLRGRLQRLGGRWLSAWAGDVVPRQPPYRPLPRDLAAVVAPAEAAAPRGKPSAGDGSLRPLQRVGGASGSPDRRRVLLTSIGAVGSGALLFILFYFSVDPLTRWWLSIYGPMDTEDVPTDLPGPPPDAEPPPRPKETPTTAKPPTATPAAAQVAGSGVAPSELATVEVAVVVPPPPEVEPPEPADPSSPAAALALATPDALPEPAVVPRAPVVVQPVVVPPAVDSPLRSSDPLRAPLLRETKAAFGEDWEEVGRDQPVVKLEVHAPMADALRVVCANGVRADGKRKVALEARRGRCDVRMQSLGDESRGSFRPEDSGTFICRVEFADELRCHPD